MPERFRAVAPSAALVKGLSPDSSYREWGGMIQKSLGGLKRQVLIYLAHGASSASARAVLAAPMPPAADTALAARPLRRPTQFDQLRDDCVAVIALDFNDAAAHRAAGPAAFFEFGGQRLDIGG